LTQDIPPIIYLAMSKGKELVELATGYWGSFALLAAVELDVFRALAAEPASAAELAEKLDCAADHLQALLDALAGAGVLEKGQGQYAIPDEARPFLDPESPDCLIDALRFNSDLAGLWMKLPDCVRAGKPVLPGNPHLGRDEAQTRRFVQGMHSRAGVMARGLLSCLTPKPGSRILDLGAGPMTFSLKLLERDPTLDITAVDLPPILAAARAIHADHPLLSKLSFLEGDYHAVDYPESRDMILHCGALHQETEDQAAELLRKIYHALAHGGELVIVDMLLDETRTVPGASALFQVNMMLMRPSSRVHTLPFLQHAAADAGFVNCTSIDVPDTPYWMVKASRPDR